MSTVFETETCGRCGGSGKYSYNQIDGDRCYGCGGKGIRLTKRGKAASLRYTNSLKVRLGELKVGDVIRVEGMTNGGGFYTYYAPIIEISEPKEYGYSVRDGVKVPTIGIEVTTNHTKFGRSGLMAPVDHETIKRFSKEETEAKLADALAYQASLTKAGKVNKRIKEIA